MDGDELLLETPAAGNEGGDGGGAGAGDDLDLGLEETGEGGTLKEGEEPGEGELREGEEPGEKQPEEKQDDKEEPQLKEFHGMVSAKLRSIIKDAPELAQVFKKYPAVQARFERIARREAALSEVWPTIAEAQQMRDEFPNGQADVQELRNEAKEIVELDNAFDTPGEEGDYPGHEQLIKNFVDRDKTAAIALFKRLPIEWAKVDKESYNDVMRQVVAATFQSRNIPDFINRTIADAKKADNLELEEFATTLFNWVDGFFKEKPKPSEEEQRLARDRAQLAKDRQKDSRDSQQRFHATFRSESMKLQTDIIKSHKVIQKLMTIKSVPQEKKDAIVNGIRSAMEKFLSKSPSFMNKLRPAYQKQNLQETTALQKNAWSQAWLLNRMVRMVLQKEVPQMVSSNREAVRRRAGAPVRSAAPANKPGEKRDAAPTRPYQKDGRWYKPDGRPFTSAEILAGKHEQ